MLRDVVGSIAVRTGVGDGRKDLSTSPPQRGDPLSRLLRAGRASSLTNKNPEGRYAIAC